MWIDDDGMVSSVAPADQFRSLPLRARWALWTADPDDLEEFVDDVTSLETAVRNAALCRREWQDQAAYRDRQIPAELVRGLRELRSFTDVREHLLSFPLALSMQWQTDAAQIAVDIVVMVKYSGVRRKIFRGVHVAARGLRVPGLGRDSHEPSPVRRIAPLDACAAPGHLVDEDGEWLGEPLRHARAADATSRRALVRGTWRRLFPPVPPEEETASTSCFLRNPAVPPASGWLPAGIAGRIRRPGYPHPRVMVRRMHDDLWGRPDPYRLMLPEDEFRYGDGEREWMVGTAAWAYEQWPEGGLIDVITSVLHIEWSTSPHAWEEARSWFVARSDREWQEMTSKERRSLERALGPRGSRTSLGYFDVDPFEGPM